MVEPTFHAPTGAPVPASGRPIHLREWMDEPDVDIRSLARILRFIRRVNRYLGGTRAVLLHLQDWSRQWLPQDGPIVIADVATGSADIPEAILRWADAHGQRIQLVALDIHAATLAYAGAWTRQRPELQLVRGNALRLPLANGSVDYAICSMFTHHLDDAAVLTALRELLRVSRRGVIVNDLLRWSSARIWVWLMTVLASGVNRHDARTSVAKGFTLAEVRRWPAAVSAPWLRCRVHPLARFTLAGERPLVAGERGKPGSAGLQTPLDPHWQPEPARAPAPLQLRLVS